MFQRASYRFRTLLHSKNISEFTDNVTPFTIQFVAGVALFLFLIQPLLYLREGFEGKITSLAHGSYSINLDAVMPLILVFWGIVVFFLILKSIRHKITIGSVLIKNPAYIFFICFIIWMMISVAVNGFTDITLLGDSYRDEGIMTYACYICVFFFLGSIIYDERIKRVLCETSLIASVGTAIFAYYRFNFLQTATDRLEYYPTAFFNQFNHYGYFLALNIMLAAAMLVMSKSIGWSIWYMIVIVVNVWMLNLNNTLGAWLACIAGFVFMMVARAAMSGHIQWKPLIPAAIFFAVTIVMSIRGNGQLSEFIRFTDEMETLSGEAVKTGNYANTGTTGARWLLWKEAVHLIKERPVFGYGIEGTAGMMEQAAGNDRCHCEYMQYALSFGIPAAVFYTIACICVIARNVRLRKFLKAMAFVCLTAAFTYMVSAVVGNSMSNTAPYFFIFLGLGYRSEKA